jgi:uncharacterized protein with PQ loop repeat
MLYFSQMAVNPYHRHFHTRRKNKKTKSGIDRWVYFAVLFGPIMTIPQVYDIWFLGKDAVSLITWLAYAVVAVIWLLYGLKHKDMPIIIVQILWLIVDAAIISGILLTT